VRKGHKIAVLAVDPSSTVTPAAASSATKTRMKCCPATCAPSSAFPSSGTLGGVARKSGNDPGLRSAGFDVILVETVGVGQSETTVRSMVDFFLLLMISGAGDELQGIKKGIMNWRMRSW